MSQGINNTGTSGGSSFGGASGLSFKVPTNLSSAFGNPVSGSTAGSTNNFGSSTSGTSAFNFANTGTVSGTASAAAPGSNPSTSFGSTQPKAGGLFGGGLTTGTTSTGLFGGAGQSSTNSGVAVPSMQSTTSTFNFGLGQPSTTSNAQGTSAQPTAHKLSGFAQSTASQPIGASSLFGKPADGSSSSSLFGKPAESLTSNQTTKPAFNFGAPSNPSATLNTSTPAVASSLGSLFGSQSLNTSGKGLFGLSTSQAPAGGSGLFGKPAEPAQTHAAGAPNASTAASGALSLFSLGTSKPAESKAAPPGGLFGNNAKNTSSLGLLSTSASTGLFGKTDASKADTETNSKAEPSKEASGGLFGAQPDASKQTSGGIFGNSDSKSSGFSFGKPEVQGGSLLGNKTEQKSDVKPDAAKPSFALNPTETKIDKSMPSFSFGAPSSATAGAAQGTNAPATASLGTNSVTSIMNSNTATAPTAPSGESRPEAKTETKDQPNLKPTQVKPIAVSLDNKTVDDLIMSWSQKLSHTKDVFGKYTQKVREWDEKLAATGQDIMDLHQESVKVEGLQQRIDQQLMFVESQQDELDKILDNYEQQADILLANIDSSGLELAMVPGVRNAGSASNIYVTDDLREKAYYNAEVIDEKLTSLGDNLAGLIENINSISDAFNKEQMKGIAGEGDDAGQNLVDGTVKLINLHLDSLKYIESKKGELESRVRVLKQGRVQ